MEQLAVDGALIQRVVVDLETIDPASLPPHVLGYAAALLEGKRSKAADRFYARSAALALDAPDDLARSAYYLIAESYRDLNTPQARTVVTNLDERLEEGSFRVRRTEVLALVTEALARAKHSRRELAEQLRKRRDASGKFDPKIWVNAFALRALATLSEGEKDPRNHRTREWLWDQLKDGKTRDPNVSEIAIASHAIMALLKAGIGEIELENEVGELTRKMREVKALADPAVITGAFVLYKIDVESYGHIDEEDALVEGARPGSTIVINKQTNITNTDNSRRETRNDIMIAGAGNQVDLGVAEAAKARPSANPSDPARDGPSRTDVLVAGSNNRIGAPASDPPTRHPGPQPTAATPTLVACPSCGVPQPAGRKYCDCGQPLGTAAR